MSAKRVRGGGERFLLYVEKDYRSVIEDVVVRLEALGARVDETMPSLGIITGTTASGQSLYDLKIEGVKEVETDRDVGVG